MHMLEALTQLLTHSLSRTLFRRSPIIHEDGGGEDSKVVCNFDRDDDQLVYVQNKVYYAYECAYVCSHTHTHTYIYIYMYRCAYIHLSECTKKIVILWIFIHTYIHIYECLFV